ncbi:MAG: acyl-CoA dehydrogenase, partial [Myxococcaceae bacterium]|nr:acyl-CoA dehydrogenase [Myxococcaceae bacterium]
MSTGINRYQIDLRELNFVLLEQYGYAAIAGKGQFKDWGVDEAK